MKKIFLLLIFCLTFCSCDKRDDVYVKNIFLDFDEDYQLQISYYDFAQEEESYGDKNYHAEDIEDFSAQIMEDEKYSFRLCENVFISKEILSKNMNDTVNFIKNSGIPITVNIAVATKILDEDRAVQCRIYNLSQNQGKVTGGVEDGETGGRYIIYENEVIDFLPFEKSVCLDLLTDNVTNVEYIFQNEKYYADLDRINTAYAVKNDEFVINIDMFLKSFTGTADTGKGRKEMKNLLMSNIKENIYRLIDDENLKRIYNFKWLRKQKGDHTTKLRIDINIY
mgnify:FL=1